jgi:chromosome partitioning protein
LAHIIVVGNEKGGSGKSTTCMHVATALARMGHRVGALDLDLRQKSFARYIENRQAFVARSGLTLSMPLYRDLPEGEATDDDRLAAAMADLARQSDFIVIDCPGSHTRLSQVAHSMADTLITPLNDSFVDFDLLGDVNPQTLEVLRPSFYSEMVWNCRKKKAQTSRRPIDWVVMRNRMSPLAARNKERVGGALENLSKRIGFRLAPGLSERVIYRELFPAGLTLLDLSETASNVAFTMSHKAARQELRDLVIVLQLPELAGIEITF